MTEATPWVDGLTLGEMLSIRTVESADQEAFVFSQQSVRWTYANFNNQVLRAARALLALQVKPGEHIGVWATNWPQWLVMQFSSALVGAPLVNINPAYRGAELEYVLNNADISTLILIDRFKTSDYFAILESICPEVPESNGPNLNSARCPALKRIISMQESSREGYLGWDDFMQRSDLVTDSELEERRISRGADEIVNIQYTSGTTGFPKGVLLSHRNLLMNAFFVGQRMAITPLDRICIPVPFYHCFGCVMGNLVTVEYGATGVIPNEYFEPRATLQALSEEQCTAVYGVPAMFIAQLGLLGEKDYDLSSLRTGIMAGSPCPIEIMRQVANDMGASEITIAYGLTEASPVITQTHTHDDLELRVSTVGPPLPGIEVKIVSPETGEDLPEEKQGELWVRGHGVMQGYYKRPEDTAKAIDQEGWLRTGDLAIRRENGFFRITGRIKDMLIRGGENIYPREIEEFLYTHPAIRDVQVVGLPDPKLGEEVSAWIVVVPGSELTVDEVQDYCRADLAHYKVPRYVFFVDHYPLTVTGKIRKFKLREIGIERLGLQTAAGTETA